MSACPPLALLPSDALAFAMVAILSFAFGMIAGIFFVMARSSSHRSDVGIDELLEDEDGENHDGSGSSRNVGAGDPPGETRESWEQDPDWWRR